MPRPGQQAYRRKKQQDRDRESAADAVDSAPALLRPGNDDDEDEADDDEQQPKTVAGQALPVAVLPEDFDGDASDGATYLALANRETASLPFYKRVQPPAHLVAEPQVTEAATGERHPALPRESWQTLFSAHFKAYRGHLQSLPQLALDPDLPKPRDAAGWLGYIQGVARKSSKGKERATEEDDDAEEGDDLLGIEVDEEEQVNDDLAEEEAVNDAPKLVPREPVLSVIRTLDTPSILMIIRHLTFYTTATLENMDKEHFDPLPACHARWAFALLALVDEQLTSDDISVLRDFARAAASAAAWRWSSAVTNNQVKPTPITEGFYGDGSPVTTDKWALGAKWKQVRDTQPRSEPSARPTTTGLDEDLAQAWMCAHAVVSGWSQWDLMEDFERTFSKLPKP